MCDISSDHIQAGLIELVLAVVLAAGRKVLQKKGNLSRRSGKIFLLPWEFKIEPNQGWDRGYRPFKPWLVTSTVSRTTSALLSGVAGTRDRTNGIPSMLLTAPVLLFA